MVDEEERGRTQNPTLKISRSTVGALDKHPRDHDDSGMGLKTMTSASQSPPISTSTVLSCAAGSLRRSSRPWRDRDELRRGLVILMLIATMVSGGCAESDDLPSAQDAVAVMRVLRDVGKVGDELVKRPAFWTRSSTQPLDYDERAWLLPLFASFIDEDFALSAYTERFLFQRKARDRGRQLALVRAIGLGSYASRLGERLRLLRLVGDNAAIWAALDEGSPEHGITRGQLTRISIEAARPDTVLQLDIAIDALAESRPSLPAVGATPVNLNQAWHALAAKRRAERLGKPLSPKVEAAIEGLDVDVLLATVATKAMATATSTRDAYRKSGGALLHHVIKAMLGNEVSATLSPLVTDIALWLGDTRLRAGGRHLISEEQLDEVQKQLQPGDVVVERRNWYLSNLGLPGFWPHAALYVGSPQELATWADDDEVRKLFPKGLIAHIKEKSPTAYAAYEEDHDGAPSRIIEAVSEGVIFATFHHSCLADHVAFLRPRRTKAERAWAVAESFKHYGKPYDFDFDFQTITSLVCSELVYTAYNLPKSVGEGLDLDPLPSVMGIVTLPPNDLIARFDDEYGKSDATFEFVAFLDGKESLNKAIRADAEDLRRSWLRPKWDLNQ